METFSKYEMSYIIETRRLGMREFTLQDVDFILRLLNTPGWIRYIGDRNVKTPEQAKRYLEDGPLKSYRINGYGLCLVEKKDDSQAIGMCGILKRETLDTPDIGFAFLPEYCGMGYALETAEATMVHARDKWNLSKIAAITVPDNLRSINLLEKLGLRYIKKLTSPGSEELSLYSN